MVIPFALLLLLLIFVMVFTLAEMWDQVRQRFFIVVATTLLVLMGALVGLRYLFTFPTGCILECTGANLVGRDLADQDLSGANFVEANLSGANLTGAELVKADLSGATLTGAILEGANLQDATLLGADLTGANLAGAKLDGANLSGANLTGANLTAVDLTQTVLKGAQLVNAQLVDVDLSNSDLSAIQLTDANLNGARLNNANLSGAVLSGADLSGAHLTNSNLSGAWLNRTSLVVADLTNSDLAGSSLVGANLASADLSESSLVGSILVGADLKGVNLSAANLRAVVLNRTALSTTLALALDPKLQELNTLQRGQILVDARLDGVSFDRQTVWPNPAVEKRFAGDEESNVATAQVTETIKVGLLHSLSGPLAISELPIRDAVLLAIDEINKSSRVLGKTIVPILADAASDPTVSAEKARQLIAEDGVVALFGCLFSTCRKAVLPVVEEYNNLLFYPDISEGFESSPNIFYIGAEPSQHIVPAFEYLLDKGYTNILLVGSDAVFPHTANKIVQARLAADKLGPAVERYFPLDVTDFSQLIEQLKAAPPQAIFNTMVGTGNVHFFQQLNEAGFTPEKLPILSTSIAEEEIQVIGPKLMAGYLVGGNYFQTTKTPENSTFVTNFKRAYGQERVTNDGVQAGYIAVYLWKTLVETAYSTTTVDLRTEAATGRIKFPAPEGLVRIDGRTQHLYKTARVGEVRDDGLIYEVFASKHPLPPDPFLTHFLWAAELEEQIKVDRETGK